IFPRKAQAPAMLYILYMFCMFFTPPCFAPKGAKPCGCRNHADHAEQAGTTKTTATNCGRRGAPRQSISELFFLCRSLGGLAERNGFRTFFVVEGDQNFIVIEVNSIDEGVDQR